MGKTPDYYQILGVNKDATSEEIKKAYRKAARVHHPDAGGDEEKFKEINEAYEVLSDPEKKRIYDQFGTSQSYAGNSYGNSQYGSVGGQYTTTGDVPWVSWDEILNAIRNPQAASDFGFDFSDLFASKIKEDNQRRYYNSADSDDFASIFNGTGSTRNKKLYDIQAQLNVPLETLVNGGNIHTKLDSVNVNGQTINLNIKPNTKPNTKIRLNGRGHTNPKTGQTGDLYITLIAEVPPDVELDENNNIKQTFDLLFTKAIIGGKVSVRLFNNKTINLTIPENTKNGTRFSIKDAGFDGASVILIANIIIPSLTKDQIKIVEQLDKELS